MKQNKTMMHDSPTAAPFSRQRPLPVRGRPEHLFSGGSDPGAETLSGAPSRLPVSPFGSARSNTHRTERWRSDSEALLEGRKQPRRGLLEPTSWSARVPLPGARAAHRQRARFSRACAKPWPSETQRVMSNTYELGVVCLFYTMISSGSSSNNQLP